ncbi:germination protein, Ger(x)C family [Chlamydia abortus]|nr:germination protein, Ger(x)C family [Chlamydia abortus]
MVKKWFGLTILLLTILTGCGDQRILEKAGFIETESFDLLPNGQFLISNSVPITEPGVKTQRKVLTTEAKSSKEAKVEFARQTSLTLVNGQLRNLIFGVSLAKQGLWDQFDTFSRDPSVSPHAKIAIVNGSASSLLAKDFKQHPRTDQYIDRLLTKEAKEHAIPKVTLYEFTRDFLDDGIDPVVPVIREDRDNISLDGIGLFKGSRYITKIEPDDALIFGFLRDNVKRGNLDVELGQAEGENELVMFNSLTSRRNIKVKRTDSGSPEVEINVKVKGSILEYIGPRDLSEEKNRSSIETMMSDHITRRANKMVKHMQMNRVDSLGIGKYVRNNMSYEAWKAMDWEQKYPDAKVKCKIRFKIKDTGKIEK